MLGGLRATGTHGARHYFIRGFLAAVFNDPYRGDSRADPLAMFCQDLLRRGTDVASYSNSQQGAFQLVPESSGEAERIARTILHGEPPVARRERW